MGKKYNIALVRKNYSYTVEQIADLFNVSEATVRRWINKEGLQRLQKVRPHLVHSSALKAFIEKQQAKQKKPCTPTTLFCMKCQQPRLPIMRSGIPISLGNGSIRYHAQCSVCRTKICKGISGRDWNENHPLHDFLSDAPEEHRGVQIHHRKCSIQEEIKQ